MKERQNPDVDPDEDVEPEQVEDDLLSDDENVEDVDGEDDLL